MLLQRSANRIIISSLAVLAMTLTSFAAHAHAVLVGSSVRDKLLTPQTEVIATARFNVKIETELTKVLLRNAKGEEKSLKLIADPARNVVRVKLPPLVPGTYLLEYKVLAADGHYTAELVRFRVAQPH